MKKLIHRVMAFSLSFLLAINTASAGRWFQSCLCPPVDVCPPTACGPVDCGPTYNCNVDCGMGYYGGWEATTVYQPACGGCSDCGSAPIESSDCGCNGTEVMENAVTESSADYQPTYSEPTYDNEPAYEAAAPSVAPALPTPVASEEQAVAPVAPIDAFSDTPEVIESPVDLFEEVPAEEPAAFNEPSGDEANDDLFSDVMVEDEVAVGDEVAFGEEPMDAFGEEGFASEPTVEEEAVVEEDNLFGEEPADELMEEPADDLFGEEVAADEPMATPADDTAEDLFGDEPMDDFAADEFEEEAASDEGFSEEDFENEGLDDGAFADDEDFDDEDFGEEMSVEETPAFGEEAPADDAGDLFGEEPADEFVDEFADDAGDLFGEESADDAGDLFGEEADDFGGADDFAPAEEAPADAPVDEDAFDFDETPAEEPSDEDAFDDLFGSLGAILQEPGGYFATTTRTWVDNTGTFSCVGRLVTVEGSNVRLRKTNGTTTIVPMGRLSSRDLEFVNRQASAQYEVELIRTAQR